MLMLLPAVGPGPALPLFAGAPVPALALEVARPRGATSAGAVSIGALSTGAVSTGALSGAVSLSIVTNYSSICYASVAVILQATHRYYLRETNHILCDNRQSPVVHIRTKPSSRATCLIWVVNSASCKVSFSIIYKAPTVIIPQLSSLVRRSRRS